MYENLVGWNLIFIFMYATTFTKSFDEESGVRICEDEYREASPVTSPNPKQWVGESDKYFLLFSTLL